MSDPLEDTFVLRAGRRATLALRGFFLAAIAGAGVLALAVAIAQPKGDGQGGAGNVVVPVTVTAFALLGFAFTWGQWWDDATSFTVRDDRLIARHGGRRLRGHGTVFAVHEPVALVAEGSRGAERLFVQQGDARIDLGKEADLGAEQLRAWTAWARTHGVTVERAGGGTRGR